MAALLPASTAGKRAPPPMPTDQGSTKRGPAVDYRMMSVHQLSSYVPPLATYGAAPGGPATRRCHGQSLRDRRGDGDQGSDKARPDGAMYATTAKR